MKALVLKQSQATPPSPEAQKLLEQLRDIHEPAPIGWWPPAPGWWLLALLLLACAAAVFLWLRHKRRQRLHNRYRAEAVRLLQSLDVRARTAPQEINEILKRVAVTTYGRPACGNLTGRPWLDFLQRSSEIQCPDTVIKVVLQQMYRADNKDKAGNEAFRNYAIEWVQLHRQSRPATAQVETAEAAEVGSV